MLPAYAQSKLGNHMFSNTLARKLPAGITSQAMHPGGVASPIYRELPRWQYAMMRPFLIGPDRPGKLAAELAIGPQRRGENGGYFSIQHPRIVSSAARDEVTQEALYKQSCVWAEVAPLGGKARAQMAA